MTCPVCAARAEATTEGSDAAGTLLTVVTMWWPCGCQTTMQVNVGRVA